jgi:hypothetical protein
MGAPYSGFISQGPSETKTNITYYLSIKLYPNKRNFNSSTGLSFGLFVSDFELWGPKPAVEV